MTGPEVPKPESPRLAVPADRRARALLFAARGALVAGAAGALAIAIAFGRVHRDDAALAARETFTCPMHPEVVAREAGTCPICRMKLESTPESDRPGGHAHASSSTFQTIDSARQRTYAPDAPAPAWIEDDGSVTAILYGDEVPAAAPGAPARFVPSKAHDGDGVSVAVSDERPAGWDESTWRVRFRADREAGAPGDFGWLRLERRGGRVPVVPRSAVLESGEGGYVLVASADGRTLTRRPVTTGRTFGGATTITGGVRSGERVLTSSAFFLDAELRSTHASALDVTP